MRDTGSHRKRNNNGLLCEELEVSNDATLPLTDGTVTQPAAGRARTSDRLPLRSRLGRYAPVLFALLVLFLLYAGWVNREESPLTAESGAGYALGIIGGSLMLLLLLYPLRKKHPAMRRWGPVKYWFRAHMIMGVVGPVCVIFHTNFQLGSLNSNVALGCMLLVAGSGLVGRYFYRKIHFGLYGRKATLKELAQAALISKGQLDDSLHLTPRMRRRLKAYERLADAHPTSLLGSALHVLRFTWLTRWNHFVLRRFLRETLAREAAERGWNRRQRRQRRREAERHLRAYLATVRQVTELGFYERLFSWWHVLHLPLFLMMVVSGLIHVYAVHAY